MQRIQNDSIMFRGESFQARKLHWAGTHRIRAPEETYRLIQPHFQTCGISRLADITRLDRIGIPTTLAIRPNSKTLAVCSGKGFSLATALTSGAMEAIELHHAENVSIRSFRRSYKEVSEEHRVIPIRNLLLTKHSLFNEAWPYHWALAWDILTQQEVAVPLSTIEMSRSRSRIRELGAFQVSSNGLASGNNFIEALAAALYEVVERDATTCHRLLWQQSGSPPPLLDVQLSANVLVQEILLKLKAASITPFVFDCTVDTKVPVFMALLHDSESPLTGLYKGYGAHLDPSVAICRALTEAVQARAIFIAGSRDDFFRQQFHRLKRVDTTGGMASFLSLSPTVDPNAIVDTSTSSFEGDVRVILSQLEHLGYQQVLVFDLTLPKLPISVVKVIVPGLEGYMFDFYTPGSRAITFLKGYVK